VCIHKLFYVDPNFIIQSLTKLKFTGEKQSTSKVIIKGFS
jgi:hypothetical protein